MKNLRKNCKKIITYKAVPIARSSFKKLSKISRRNKHVNQSINRTDTSVRTKRKFRSFRKREYLPEYTVDFLGDISSPCAGWKAPQNDFHKDSDPTASAWHSSAVVDSLRHDSAPVPRPSGGLRRFCSPTGSWGHNPDTSRCPCPKCWEYRPSAGSMSGPAREKYTESA